MANCCKTTGFEFVLGTSFQTMPTSTRSSPCKGAAVGSPGGMERLANALEEQESEVQTVGGSPSNPANLFGSPESETGFSKADLAATAGAAADAVTPNNNPPPPPPSSAPRAAKKTSPPGKTTARKGKKSKAATAIELGCRISANRRSLVQTGILSDVQKDSLTDFPGVFDAWDTEKWECQVWMHRRAWSASRWTQNCHWRFPWSIESIEAGAGRTRAAGNVGGNCGSSRKRRRGINEKEDHSSTFHRRL